MLVTSLMFLCFLMFSIILLNMALFMSEEIFLEIVFSLSSELGVEIDVGFHPCRLIKFNRMMNFL